MSRHESHGGQIVSFFTPDSLTAKSSLGFILRWVPAACHTQWYQRSTGNCLLCLNGQSAYGSPRDMWCMVNGPANRGQSQRLGSGTNRGAKNRMSRWSFHTWEYVSGCFTGRNDRRHHLLHHLHTPSPPQTPLAQFTVFPNKAS